jgi:PadR family transcriptional regulator, regulatory protein PadR
MWPRPIARFSDRYLAMKGTVLYKVPAANMTEPIDIQLKKGVLELCVLELLAQEDSYAYEIASRLADAIGMGEGTVYPLMRRLHTEGLVETYFVESSTGPSRKYYRITRTGRSELARERSAWHSFTRAVNGIVGGRK